MQKRLLITAGVFGGLAVALGAFGAHALRDFLERTQRLDTYTTAVQYQFYHTFALLAVALLHDKFNSKSLKYSAICFIAGILLFSGSLYLLIFTQQNLWGAVTPFGGILLIGGWMFLVASALK